MFITLEGTEGVGKTTQANLLEEFFTKNGYEVVRTREPGGGGQVGDMVRSVLINVHNVDTMSELLLIYAARRQHLITTIIPALEQKKIVICDRYYDSSVAYFAYNQTDIPAAKQIVDYLHTTCAFGIMPTLTILLDGNPAEFTQRINTRGIIGKYDAMSIEDISKIRNVFHHIAQQHTSRVKIVDATQTTNHVHQQITTLINTIKQ
jgi:dTMP kinase